ncbi:MAG: PTS sugar transporter subunit IIB [Clostridiales bacterium]|nr:PTS sugar transporter subunit IIB [Clostridiales bacterium]
MAMKREIRTIMCCCGNGVGTSLIMQMTIEEALEHLGRTDINVIFGSLSDVSEDKADLFVVSQELLTNFEDLLVIGLEDLMDSNKAAIQLKSLLESI